LPEGLEGVEGYPNLLVELTRRGWNEHEIAGLTGGNLLRALREAERVAAQN
jgi:membrane dipeptidase